MPGLPPGYEPLMRVVSAPDDERRRVELVLAWRDGEYGWSLRVDSWDQVVAARWHPLEPLCALGSVADDARGTITVTDDVTIVSDGMHADVTVTAVDGRSATARDLLRGLTHTARSLVERAEEQRGCTTQFWTF